MSGLGEFKRSVIEIITTASTVFKKCSRKAINEKNLFQNEMKASTNT